MSCLRFLSLLLLTAAPAGAAERSVAITDFDRIRVDGPFTVTVATRASPGVVVTGDPRLLNMVTVTLDGGTLVVRRTSGSPALPKGVIPPVVRVSTRDLRSAGVVGGGQLTVAGPMAAARVDLTVTGAGTIAVPGLAADQLIAMLIGTGELRLGGTARSARLLTNGAGAITAGDLTANDVVVRTDGPAAVTVTARYTATASSTGAGPITILGKPDCKTRAAAGGLITCFNPKPL